METTGDKGRRGARVTKRKLREALTSLCRNKAALCHFPLKAPCLWAGADQALQPNRKIIR